VWMYDNHRESMTRTVYDSFRNTDAQLKTSEAFLCLIYTAVQKFGVTQTISCLP